MKKFYLSAVEKTFYKAVVEAEDADEAVAKFKEVVEQGLVGDGETYLDEVMCRAEDQEFPELYEGSSEDEDDDEDDEDDDLEEDVDDEDHEAEDYDGSGEDEVLDDDLGSDDLNKGSFVEERGSF